MAETDALAVLRSRGLIAQITDETALAARLQAGPITFYAGFDPTAPSLHVGSCIPLLAMAHLARAGHSAIAVLGGGTAMVGDPSGKTEMRQLVSAETIAANRQGIEPQVRSVLGPNATIVDNGEWLLPLNYVAFLRDIGRHFSVNRMLAAEAYKARLEKGLSFIEFNYQLLQAYDFLALNQRFGCALQVGHPAGPTKGSVWVDVSTDDHGVGRQDGEDGQRCHLAGPDAHPTVRLLSILRECR
jgi:tyrosyl-tRNA synthetase